MVPSRPNPCRFGRESSPRRSLRRSRTHPCEAMPDGRGLVFGPRGRDAILPATGVARALIGTTAPTAADECVTMGRVVVVRTSPIDPDVSTRLRTTSARARPGSTPGVHGRDPSLSLAMDRTLKPIIAASVSPRAACRAEASPPSTSRRQPPSSPSCQQPSRRTLTSFWRIHAAHVKAQVRRRPHVAAVIARHCTYDRVLRRPPT